MQNFGQFWKIRPPHSIEFRHCWNWEHFDGCRTHGQISKMAYLHWKRLNFIQKRESRSPWAHIKKGIFAWKKYPMSDFILFILDGYWGLLIIKIFLKISRFLGRMLSEYCPCIVWTKGDTNRRTDELTDRRTDQPMYIHT